MRLHTALITATTDVRQSVYLIELYAPSLVQAVQPGQFCMVRCSPPGMTDPLLRRPFYIHSLNRSRETCALLVHVQGRGSAWLASQREGTELDLLGPLGRGWEIRPTVRNLLLLSEERHISSLTLLAQVAIEQELAVTLINLSRSDEASYPPALLPPEVEYHVVIGNNEQHEPLMDAVNASLSWADAVYCSIAREMALTLYGRFERIRGKNFAQGTLTQPLVCGTGICFACSVETRSGQRLICRDGPVFDLREIVR